MLAVVVALVSVEVALYHIKLQQPLVNHHNEVKRSRGEFRVNAKGGCLGRPRSER